MYINNYIYILYPNGHAPPVPHKLRLPASIHVQKFEKGPSILTRLGTSRDGTAL